MLKLLDNIIVEFRCCFSRQAAFYWFVIVIMGFIIRFDHHGVSSFIRWLFINPEYYETLLQFFRASSWSIDGILSRWTVLVINLYPLIKFNDRILLIGDGIKICKEAKRMPAVKRLHQDSDNSGKGEYILGHHFGSVGILTGHSNKAFCLPIHAQIHEGVDSIRPAEGINGKPSTLITRMANLVVQTAMNTGKLCYVTLDAYFSTSSTFLIFKKAVNKNGHQLVHVITRAKDNYVAYHNCEFSEKKFHKDNKVKLKDWFKFPEFFDEVEVTTYGKSKKIEIFCLNLIWKPIDDFVRFVFVKDGEGSYILMCSDLKLSPIEIVKIYSYRSKIEVMFLYLKHIIGGFCYRFWTKSLPKFNRKVKLDLSTLTEKELEKVSLAFDAIEKFVNLAGISLGLLQYLALTQASAVWESYHGWLRTRSSEIPSEWVVQSVIQSEFFSVGSKVPAGRTLRIILKKIRSPLINMNLDL